MVEVQITPLEGVKIASTFFGKTSNYRCCQLASTGCSLVTLTDTSKWQINSFVEQISGFPKMS